MLKTLFQSSLCYQVERNCAGFKMSSVSKENPRKRKAEKTSAQSSKEKKTAPNNGVSKFEGKICKTDEEVRTRDGYEADIPRKNKKGVLVFENCETFAPNMTPKEVLQKGSFGGTYFRPIKSSVTGLKYDKQWLELPQDWLEGLDIKRMISNPTYNEEVNTYKKKCGGDLEMWESSGWIKEQDPYGWFQWYCRFYLGRRTDDDERQIKRWSNCTGPKGRWKNTLIGKIYRAECGYDNVTISPVVRQVLQHWAYTLTKEDFEARKKFLQKQGK